MAVDMFLKIDGIPGKSTDVRHRDEIDIPPIRGVNRSPCLMRSRKAALRKN
jgi:type VI protein secretion system component Hcp